MTPFLSIVTISFNQGQYLRQCVESVLENKPKDVEYIVVDAGSKDSSREILERYRSDIDRLILEPDNGPADGLNKGFAHAHGRYGYFINADDFLLPRAIEKLRCLWEKCADVDVIFCGAWMVNSLGRPLREMVPTKVTRETLLERSAITVQQGTSFRLAKFHRVGGFNESNHTCWDAELIFDLVRAGAQTKVFHERIGAFRLHSDSITSQINDIGWRNRYQTERVKALSKLDPNRKYSSAFFGEIAPRFYRYIRNPRTFYVRLHDLLIPGAVERRWRLDMASPISGNSRF